jgi:redox-sensing transcriptional repressor
LRTVATHRAALESLPEGEKVKKGERPVSVSTVERLSVYRKLLEELHYEGVEYVYSQQLADMVGVTPAQLRRDLASFGSFGNISRGYNVYQLTRTISRILGTDVQQTVALLGVGDLGRSLLAYRGFEERGFHIGVVFDVDAAKVGRVFAGRRCHHIDELEAVLPEYDVRLAVLACRPVGLQQLVDRLGQIGILSILNFVPKRVTPPKGGYVESIDIAAKLEKLSFLGKQV